MIFHAKAIWRETFPERVQNKPQQLQIIRKSSIFERALQKLWKIVAARRFRSVQAWQPS
jgi:hypothetical protein